MKGCISKKLVSLMLSLALCATAVPMVSLSSSAAGTVTPKVATGSSHTVLLKADGSVWATGSNEYGQLGIGKSKDDVPETATFTQCVDSTGAEIKNATDIACGRNHTAVIRRDGELWQCGYNKYGQLGTGDSGQDENGDDKYEPQFEKSKENTSGNEITDAIAVACGENHTAVIRSGGQLWQCGYNVNGQLGIGTSGSNADTNYFEQSQEKTSGNEITDAEAVACGQQHTAVIRSGGQLWQCGCNVRDQLGVGERKNQPQFAKSKDNDGNEITNATAVVCGMGHTAVIRSGGELWQCGINYGQLGTKEGEMNNIKTQFEQSYDKDGEKIINATTVSCGFNHTAVIRSGGQLWQCGLNSNGQLSLALSESGTIKSNFLQSYDENGAITNVAAVSSGCCAKATLILSPDANGNLELLGAGQNTNGELGLGENDEIDDKYQDQTMFVSSMVLDIGKAPTSSSVETITKKGPSNPHEVTGTGEFVGVTNVTIAWGSLTYDYNAKWDPNKKEWVQNGDKEFWTASSTDADKITATNNSSEDYNVALSFTVDSDYDAGEKGEAVEGSFVRKTSSGKEEAVTGNTLNLTTASKEDTVYLKLSGMSDKITGVEDLQNQTFGVVTATLSKD